MNVAYEWRCAFDNAEVNALHVDGFDHPPSDEDWWGRVNRHSLGWVCARSGDQLVGFVNVAWDGGIHAFVLDTLVGALHQRRGIGTQLVAVATREAPCGWLQMAARRLRAPSANLLL